MAKPAAVAAGAPAAPEKKGKKKTFKKKERKHVPHGLVHVQASFNNTIVTISAQQAAMNAANMARDHGVRTVDVRVSGPGSGRESAVRALAAAGIEVRSIKDATPIPHNGCRPPKRRRV